jgi:hypothetical protein
MKAKHRLAVVNNNSEQLYELTRRSKHTVVLVAIIAAALLGAVAHWKQAENAGEPLSESSGERQSGSIGTETVYFPAQYVNQAQSSESEEHIQAF